MTDQAETNNILTEATGVVEERALSFQSKFEGMMGLKEQLGREDNQSKDFHPATMLELKGKSFKETIGDTNLPDGTYVTYNKKGEIDTVVQIITEEDPDESIEIHVERPHVEVGE